MKKEKELQRMRENLKKGENVVTSGGLCGTVLDFKGDKVILKVGDKTTLMVLRSSISALQPLVASSSETPPIKEA